MIFKKAPQVVKQKQLDMIRIMIQQLLFFKLFSHDDNMGNHQDKIAKSLSLGPV